ncbi:alpha/beta fold hydrolase [Mucilaginibacter lappiensis]|uniref:Putative alpha/beta hydrolase family protein n=1 Tax=Mucilaginibacter lappiensis TaxID=354630 RepID=A0A841JJ79_9SPHI|nr:hypothetical protein [Mucilaginibacter lappiensis]MBB6131233.1 putative alpha/beta hydrolase family protein [Mucilaginibacter lappiensis]
MKKSIIILNILMLWLLTGYNSHAQQVVGNYYTSFDGTKIYYEVKGNGFPVILVHGFSGTGEGWKKGQLYTDLLKCRLSGYHFRSAG